jgi:hypothetical protein
MSAFGGKSGHDDCTAKCPLVTQSGHANRADQCLLCLNKRAASLQPAARDENTYSSPITSDSDDSDDDDSDADSKSFLAARSP